MRWQKQKSTLLKECPLLYRIGSPTRARTWDLRINRSSHPELYAYKVEEEIATFFAPPLFPDLTELIPNLNRLILLRFLGFPIQNNPIPQFSLNRFRTHPPETKCWRATPGNSPRTAPKLPTAAPRWHPLGMAITAPERASSGQLWARAGPVFASPPRNFRPFFTPGSPLPP